MPGSNLLNNGFSFDRFENTISRLPVFKTSPKDSCNMCNKASDIFSVTTCLTFSSLISIIIISSRRHLFTFFLSLYQILELSKAPPFCWGWAYDILRNISFLDQVENTSSYLSVFETCAAGRCNIFNKVIGIFLWPRVWFFLSCCKNLWFGLVL